MPAPRWGIADMSNKRPPLSRGDVIAVIVAIAVLTLGYCTVSTFENDQTETTGAME